jgi:WD40 repeat protein/serine/threonine protein kinase
MTMHDDLPTSAPSEAQPCTTAGVTPAGPPGYELLDEVGRGGMGVVYRARDVALGRDVAVKLLSERYALDSHAAQRFVNEARITGQLQHPGIPAVHQVGHLPDGRPFLAMKLIRGCTLEAVLKDRPDLSAERGRLLAVFEAVCQAVGYAHAHRVIHRDLKPANVMVGAFGEVQVMDWGLAKVLDEKGTAPAEDGSAPEVTQAWTQVSPPPEAGSHTQAGSLVGTPAFIPPEQAAGELAKVDERADVFGLGALLAVILTGNPPYVGESFQSVRVLAVRGKLDDCLARLEACGAEPELVSLCRQCLAFEPADRPRDAGEVAQAVARFRSAAEERARAAERQKAAAEARSAEQRRRAKAEAKAKQELETNLYFHRIALVHRELSRDNLGRALEQLEQCPEGLRQWEWYYLKRLCRVDPVLFRDQVAVNSVAFSPDGELLASATSGGTVQVRKSRTGEEVQTLNAKTETVCSVAFHPGGQHLAFAGADRKVKVWDWKTGQEAFTCPSDADHNYGMAYGVAFSPDGRCLAVGSDGAVNVWDWRNRQLLLTLPGHVQKGISVAFSPDGQRLASGSWNGVVLIWDAQTGERLHLLSEHHHPVSALAFSPDGQRLVSACFDRRLIMWGATTGQRLHTLQGHDGLVLGVAFSPDGSRLASVGEDKRVRVWETATGREVLDLRGHTGWSQCVAVSPDGRRIASAGRDATIRLWDATPLQENEGQEALTFSAHDEEVFTLAVSPDGQQIASAVLGHNTPVKVWDVRTGRVSVEFTGHSGVVFCLAWHPTDERIASSGGTGDWRQPFAVKVWEARTGRVVFTLPPSTETVAMAFSPNGQHLVTGEMRGAVQVWDARTYQKVGTLDTHDQGEIRGLVFSRDGLYLASADTGGTVKLWDATRLGKEQQPRHTFRAHVPLVAMTLAFSPDGRRLVAGGEEENTVKIWDVQTGQELQTLRGHSGDVWAAAFSPDREGQWVASAGEDSTVKVWDSHTGTLVRSFRGHIGLVTSLAFSPDGRLLVSGSRDKTVKVWDLMALGEKPGPKVRAATK